MKQIKNKLILCLIIISTSLFSQVSYVYNFGDSTWTNVGVYTNKTLFIQKDSGAGNLLNSFYFKFVEPNVQFQFLPSLHDDGNPTSIFWLDNQGWVKKSPISSLILPASQITGLPIVTTPTITTGVSRSLNNAYTISTINNIRVSYTIRISYSITILLGSTSSISLQYSTNGGSTYSTINTISNNINLGIALSGYNDFVLSGEIPANALVKLTSTTSNATNTYQTGQEIKY